MKKMKQSRTIFFKTSPLNTCKIIMYNGIRYPPATVPKDNAIQQQKFSSAIV